MRFGSVCSGIEAASVAWHPLGWRAAWLSEIDKAASAVLSFRLPEVPNLGDMTAIPVLIETGIVEAPDILVGGTPCQGFSVAGRRGGLADPRGQLTLSFVEIADAIDNARRAAGDDECIVVWENVPGVLSMRDNAFGNFLAALAGEDVPLEPAGKRWPNAGVVLGPERAVAWRVLDAQYFGLAQRRRRVFVVASAREGFDPGDILFEFEGVRRDSPPSREAGEGIAGTVEDCARSRSHWEGDYPHPTLNQSFNTGSPGYSNQELFSQRGAGLVPVTPEQRRLRPPAGLAFGGGNQGGPIDISTALNASERYDFDSETFIVDPAPIAFSSKDYGADASVGVSPTLRAGGHLDSHANAGVPPAVCYGFQPRNAESGKTGKGDSAPCVAYATEDGTGRGQPIVPVEAFRVPGNCTPYSTGDRVDALTSANDSSAQFPIVSNMAVRRLMPVECERLQGFPDNWTLVPTGSKQKPAADGPRYKQCGNSMATRCMGWIGYRIKQWLELEPFRELIG